MKLSLYFDDDLIRKYVKRGSRPLFGIYWTQDQIAFPEEKWLDFGSVVLGWWLVAAKSLLEGATEAELSFMDGPFQMQVRRIGNLLYVSADEQSWKWQIPIEIFVSELLRAVIDVKRKFAELGISDKEGLQVGARDLEIALSEAKKTRSTRSIAVQHV